MHYHNLFQLWKMSHSEVDRSDNAVTQLIKWTTQVMHFLALELLLSQPPPAALNTLPAALNTLPH